MAEIEGHVGH
jgi:hypothetical protein